MRRDRGWHAVIRSFALVALFILAGLPPAAASGEERNHCGCYQDGSGACFCDKKASCGCPGECEPRGCEEKRERDLQKEIEAETKKAQEAGRKQEVSKDEDPVPQHAPAPEKGPAAHPRLSAAQARQLGKLLDLYLSGHPGTGGMSLQDLREEISSGH